jgi:DNA-binding transcriptional LysR family regulator
MDLVQIKYFLALSKTLNFTRAAEACNVTQPALTRSIQRLEHEMGGRLILRERDLTRLTDLGRHVLPVLQRTADAVDSASRMATEFRRQDTMPLRLGVGWGVSTSSLAPVLRDLHQRIPRLVLTVRQGGAEQINDWLLASEIDVGLTADGGCLTQRAIQWPLFDDRIVALVSPDHQLAGDGPIESTTIANHLIVGRVGGDTPLDIIGARLAGGGNSRKIRHCGTTEEHINDMVAAGLGVGLSTERHPCREGILRRPISPPEWLTVCLAAIPGRPRSPAVHIFIKLARARNWLLPAHTRNEEPTRTDVGVPRFGLVG